MNTSHCRVAIIGAGPTGLAVASGLAEAGVDDVVVLEREVSAGGIPRHCGHSPFGFREFHRILSGPEYARRLLQRAQAQGSSIRTATTAIAIERDGGLILSTDAGIAALRAERIVICTGNRETPRAARLVSGTRPLGIVTTAALQSMVYLKHRIPFRRPLIVGSELVSFSALMTCRHAGIRPVAMIDDRARITAWPPAALLPRLLGTPLLLGRSLQSIQGTERVTSVDVSDGDGKLARLDCDGVIFSGRFVSESSLVRASHLELDARSGGPRIDQYGRCSDARYFACGNLLHPVDTAGWCWSEGRRTAAWVAASLDGRLDETGRGIDIERVDAAIRYVSPQRIVLAQDSTGASHPGLQIRFERDLTGRLSLRDGERELSGRQVRARRERRVLLPLPSPRDLRACQSLALDFLPS